MLLSPHETEKHKNATTNLLVDFFKCRFANVQLSNLHSMQTTNNITQTYTTVVQYNKLTILYKDKRNVVQLNPDKVSE